MWRLGLHFFGKRIYSVCTSQCSVSLLDLLTLYKWKWILGTFDCHSTVLSLVRFGSVHIRLLYIYSCILYRLHRRSASFASCWLWMNILKAATATATTTAAAAHKKPLFGYVKDFEAVRIFQAHYLFPTNQTNKIRIPFNRIQRAFTHKLQRSNVNQRDTNAWFKLNTSRTLSGIDDLLRVTLAPNQQLVLFDRQVKYHFIVIILMEKKT